MRRNGNHFLEAAFNPDNGMLLLPVLASQTSPNFFKIYRCHIEMVLLCMCYMGIFTARTYQKFPSAVISYIHEIILRTVKHGIFQFPMGISQDMEFDHTR